MTNHPRIIALSVAMLAALTLIGLGQPGRAAVAEPAATPGLAPWTRTPAPAAKATTLAQAKAAPAQAPSVAPVTIRVGTNRTWDVAPLLVTDAKGYWKSRPGIQVRFVEITDPIKGLEAVNAGELDAVTVPPSNLILAKVKNVPAIAVAALNGLSDPPQVALMARSDIKSIKDLKGKTIGINNYGGAFDLHLRALLEENGLDPEKDVNVVIVPIPAILKSIESRRLDAGIVVPVFVTIARKQYPQTMHLLAGNNDTPSIKKLDNYQSMVLAMATTFVTRQRPAAVGFLRGYLDGVKFIVDNPKDALSIWSDLAGSKIIAERPAPPKLPKDGKISLDGLAFEISYLTKMGALKGNVKATDFVDHSLLDEALKGQ